MNKQVLSTSSDHPEIYVKTRNDLIVQGWDHREVSVEGCSHRSFNLRQEGDKIQIYFLEEGILWIPFNAKVMVDRVGGDAFIKNFPGNLVIQKVGGDLMVSQVVKMVADQVGGNCEVFEAAGDLELHKVGGDFLGKNIHGSTFIEKVGGDFLLQGADQTVITRAGGDIQVSLSQVQKGHSDLAAGGDISVHLPEKADLNLKLFSGGDDINVNLGKQTLKLESNSYETTLGNGSASLVLKAGGDVRITDQLWEEQLLTNFQQRFDQQLAAIEEKINSKIQEVTECASDTTHRAEKRVEEALRRIDRKTPMFGHFGNHFNASVSNVDHSFSPIDLKPAPEVSEPVSGDERMMILKMVESKKISIEEAEKLFEALEGK